jgi:hypothetical protein
MIRPGFGNGGALRIVSGFLLPIFLLVSCGQALPCIEWQKCLGGSGNDQAYSVQQTSDGGYILAGWTRSNNGNVSGNHGTMDCWVVLLDASGNLVWQKCLGGRGSDVAYGVQQTSDGGYIVAGFSGSNDGDVSGNHGRYDFWVVKLGEINCTIIAPDVVCSRSKRNVASTAASGAAYAGRSRTARSHLQATPSRSPSLLAHREL